MVNIFRLIGNKLDLFRMCRDVSRCVTMYVELITILVRAKDDITRACRRCQSTLYIVFNIKVGGPHMSDVVRVSHDGITNFNIPAATTQLLSSNYKLRF